MDAIFLKLLNMGTAAGWLILAVIILRLLFRKAPKWSRCALWGIAAFRLLCPFSLETAFSLIPSSEILTPEVVQFSPEPTIESGIPFLNDTLNPMIRQSFTPAPGASANPLHIWIFLAGIVWAMGLILLLGFALFHFLRICRKVREAVLLNDNIWICDAVKSPFILGIVRPRIYLSSSTDEESMKYILAHEQAHLKRKDHWWKLLGYLILAVYWFHPLVWAAYLLFCRDLELACDEKVIKDWNLKDRKAYSEALVACSLPKKLFVACPPAFGEIGVKERVKTILHYQKPGFWMILGACAVCILVAVCFLTNPKTDAFSLEHGLSSARVPDSLPSQAEKNGLDKSGGTANTAEPDLNAAVTAAILENNSSTHYSDYDFACCDFVSLETVTAPTDAKDSNSKQAVTIYGWALYQAYEISEEGITTLNASHLPVALTFDLDETGYLLKEYWTPREGSYYVQDIRAKFPADIAEDGIDSQKYVYQQMQSCYDQAIQFSGLNTDAVIGQLLDTICSNPKISSNPQDYLDAHVLDHHELLYYGAYTLRYCFNRFRQGGETGLEGHLMALICEELLQTKGAIPADAATAETGQFWFDTLYAHGSNRVEEYLP